MLSKNKKLFNTIKAQVTAFIIIGILIIAIVWGALYISEYFAKKDLEKFAPVGHQLTLESDTIKENIDTCVQSLTDKGMQLMSDQGLYLEIPENNSYDENHAYWLKNTINIMPSSFEKIDQDLAYYIHNNIQECANLDEFKENGWDISPFVPFTTVKIQKQDIGVEVKYTISVKKEDFEREFSNSIYNPQIRFRQMYGKSVNFINNQLLRPDFDFNNPLKEYDVTDYTIDHEELDNQTLLFSLKDTQSKVLDGRPFTLKFAADFSINNIPRTYDVSNSHETRVLYSPDRLAVLILQPGVVSSSDKLTIEPYERDNVIRKNTPSEKFGTEITKTKDILFNTDYPIYKFSPEGTTFNEPALFRIYLNKDQREIDDNFTLLYYGKNGWLPYPNVINSSEGILDSLIYGFSKYTVANCDTMYNQLYEGPIAEGHRGFFSTWGPTILTIISIAFFLASAGPSIIHAFTQVGKEKVITQQFLIVVKDKMLLEQTAKKVAQDAIGDVAKQAALELAQEATREAGKNLLAQQVFLQEARKELIKSATTGLFSSTFKGIISIPKLVWAHPFIGIGALGLTTFSAYHMWNGAIDTKDTLFIVAVCDNEIYITPHVEDGKCKCYIQDTSQGNVENISGAYSVTRGNSYTVTAAVTDFDYLHDEATCQCEIEGKVVTASTDPNPEFVDCIEDDECDGDEFCNDNNECEEKPPGPELVCCITYDGYCLDNYLDDSCNGNSTQRTCSELTSCAGDPPLTGEGNLQISSQGNPQGFGREGDTFTISYYLQSASEDTVVIAHIKKDGTEIDSISLYDDGNHNDGDPNNQYYANTWNSRNTLRNQNSAQITWDIEVRYENIRTITNEDVDSTTLIDVNSDCESMTTFSPENSLDIILAGNYYNNIGEFSQDAESAASKIILTNTFNQYNLDYGINFFKIKELFSTSILSQIKSQAISKCDYSDSPNKLVISLNNDATICKKEPNIVELNPLFAFKSGIPNVNSVLQDFCGYISELNLMNPPEAEIITKDIVTVPGDVDVEFKITDEEYPVDYELLWNHIPRKSGQVQDDSPKTHTILNLPNGDWIVQIKATDQRGSVGYSEVLSIRVNDTMQMDLSSISPLNILSGGLTTLILNDAVYDPANEPIEGWTHDPAFSTCISFSTISNGQITITHTKGSRCQETVTFTAIGSNNRRASDTIVINAG